MQVARPVDNLTVCVMWLLGAERWPSDKTLEHDCAHGPPITTIVVTLTTENLGRDVVGSTHSGVSELTTGLPPCVDLCAVADCQLNLIEVHRSSIISVRLVCATSKKLLVVASIVLLMETC